MDDAPRSSGLACWSARCSSINVKTDSTTIHCTERLDVLAHRGDVAGVSLAKAFPSGALLELVSEDGRWALRAVVTLCTRDSGGAWRIAFDRRTAVIEALAVPRPKMR
jgi:hypothetical protein